MENQEILDFNETPAPRQPRPIAITVICIIGFIGAAVAVPMVFSGVAAQIGSWYSPYLALSSAIGLVCMIGMWKMKKWGAYTYAGAVAVNQVIMLMMGIWTVFALVIPAVVVGIALYHVNKMN